MTLQHEGGLLIILININIQPSSHDHIPSRLPQLLFSSGTNFLLAPPSAITGRWSLWWSLSWLPHIAHMFTSHRSCQSHLICNNLSLTILSQMGILIPYTPLPLFPALLFCKTVVTSNTVYVYTFIGFFLSFLLPKVGFPRRWSWKKDSIMYWGRALQQKSVGEGGNEAREYGRSSQVSMWFLGGLTLRKIVFGALIVPRDKGLFVPLQQ